MPIFGAVASWLTRAGVSPNAISLWSIVFGVAAGVAMAATAKVDGGTNVRVLWFVGALFIQLRLLANMLDGMVAVEGGKGTATGDLYNEVPDRISDAATLAGAGMAIGGRLDLGLLAGLMSLLVAYVRAIGASVGVGQVFLGPAAKPHRMAFMTATCLWCALLPRSWQPVDPSTGIGVVGAALALVSLGCVITAARRLRVITDRLHER